MTDPDAVARALARLASGDARAHGAERDPERVVAEAEAAMGELGDAAGFVARGGEAALRDAVGAADRDGEEAVAARGRAVLSALARFREAAAAGTVTTSTPLAQRSSREGA